MTLFVNGEKRDFTAQITLEEVLQSLSLEGKVMAAAVNMQIIKQDTWKSHQLQEGDKLELLDFVGGG